MSLEISQRVGASDDRFQERLKEIQMEYDRKLEEKDRETRNILQRKDEVQKY